MRELQAANFCMSREPIHGYHRFSSYWNPLMDTASAPKPSNSAPTLQQRWIGAVPLFMLFLVNLASAARYQSLKQEFYRLRIGLPMPTNLALFWSGILVSYYFLWMPIMLGIGYFYFAWVAQNHRRLMWVNLMCTALLLFSSLVLIGGMFLPYMKIQDHLRDK
jgi:hypothetical protein